MKSQENLEFSSSITKVSQIELHHERQSAKLAREQTMEARFEQRVEDLLVLIEAGKTNQEIQANYPAVSGQFLNSLRRKLNKQIYRRRS